MNYIKKEVGFKMKSLKPKIIEYNNNEHRTRVISIWKEIFGYEKVHNEPNLVIDNKMESSDKFFFVAIMDNQIIGTIMGGYDGHRGWIYLLGVLEKFRKKGIGRLLVEYLERELKKLNCQKINLQIHDSNKEVVDFYKNLGYEVEERISMGKIIE